MERPIAGCTMRLNTLGFLAAALLSGIFAATTQAAAPVAPDKSADSSNSALHDEILSKYMTGDWDDLEKQITSQEKDIEKLPKDQLADVRYIVSALSDCHPKWWDLTKAGGKGVIHPSVWGRQAEMLFQNDESFHLNISSGPGGTQVSIYWPADQMESTAPGEHGFSKGDLAGVPIWGQIEQAAIDSSITPQRINQLEGTSKAAFDRYGGFEQLVTAAYYGKPRTRQWAFFLGLDAYFGDHMTESGFIPRKPVGAMFIAEIVGHPKQYPDFRLPSAVDPNTAENRLANGLFLEIGNARLSFAEDKALRDAVKQFAAANGSSVLNTGRVTLSNKQIVSLDPAQDAAPVEKRNKWLSDALAGGGSDGAASKPSDAGIPWRP